jgi:hypothetical protein
MGPRAGLDLSIDGKIILKLILTGVGWGGCGLDPSGSGREPVTVSCEHSNEPSGSIKRRGFSFLAS